MLKFIKAICWMQKPLKTSSFPNHIFKGIIVCDKGFPVSEIEHILEAYPDLHYIIPLKRNDKRIKEYDLLNFDSSPRKANGDQVLFKKTKYKTNYFHFDESIKWR